MTTPRSFPFDETPAAHIGNGLQLLVFIRAELDALEVRLREAHRLLTASPPSSPEKNDS